MQEQDYNRIITQNFGDYELLDLGNGNKLERFGAIHTLRPEIKYSKNGKRSLLDMQQAADLIFTQTSSKAGFWKENKNCPAEWIMKVPVLNKEFSFLLKPSPFKHLGIFPEQKSNWEYIAEKVKTCPVKPKVLNLFAYTGGASLVAKKFGADVTHVDSSKSVISWARKNMELNGLDDIRWCVEDALLFIQREAKRGNVYQGLIMDPPSFGIGKNKKRWRIEEAIIPLLENAVKILDPKAHFLVLNTYSPQLDAFMALKAVKLPIKAALLERAKLCLQAKTQKVLETGDLIRFSNY